MTTAQTDTLPVARLSGVELCYHIRAPPGGLLKPPRHKPNPSKPLPKEEVITTQLGIDRDRTALLVMDYQNDIVGSVSGSERTGLLHRASSVLAATRNAGIPVIYVVVSFRPGHPEVSARNKSFSGMKSIGRLQEGTPGAQVHGSVRPDAGEVIVTKRRVGAFSTTDLETVLRSKNVTSLVLAGISTSGVVLSTVRWAADADYEIVVLADCCADPDPEVHRVLTGKIFPRQATVANSMDYVHALR